MREFWEEKFRTEGAMWDFFPSDSAIRTLEIFKSNRLYHILIPGFGYGRNAKLFLENGFDVTGIEISQSAINLANVNGLNCTIHHGSVTSMPFDDKIYDGIFCYALIHVLNKAERKEFLKSCFNQLRNNGLMVFVVASDKMSMYGTGKHLSKNRFEISPGLKVFFFDSESVSQEFSPFGLIDYHMIEEPVKFMKDQDPIKMIFVICKKDENAPGVIVFTTRHWRQSE
jgi:SAM-dependent methyltransferase